MTMNARRNLPGIVLSILVLTLMAAGCAQSPSTPEESAAEGNAPAEIAAATEPEQRFVTVSLPAGTELEVELIDPLSSGTNQAGDPVSARLVGDLIADGRLVAPAGAELRGTVAEVVPLKKFGGQPQISVAFESLDVAGGDSVAIVAWLSEAGKKQTARDAAKIGAGALVGAVVGHQVDDDKGSEIGAVVGGAVGTAIAAKTGKEIELEAGTMMFVVLENDAAVRVAD
jgi:hypothetical protein